MKDQEIVSDQSICSRKERRYKSSDESVLRCETTLADCGLRHGSVLDLSSSGLRLLCDGMFETGQNIFTELTTIRSHGIYRGVIRRVEPWVNGQSVIGCSLEDKIPDYVLQDLAAEGAVNRRSDDRIELQQSAKLSWPLSGQEVDVELRDFSTGGMKVVASEHVPTDARLRFRIEVPGDEELVVEARPVWLEEAEDGCMVGVAFTDRDDPVRLAESLGLEDADGPVNARPRRVKRTLGLGVATCVVVATFAFYFSS